MRTWRQYVEEQAARFGLQDECLAEFDRLIGEGNAERNSAWSALYEWDVLPFESVLTPDKSFPREPGA